MEFNATPRGKLGRHQTMPRRLHDRLDVDSPGDCYHLTHWPPGRGSARSLPPVTVSVSSDRLSLRFPSEVAVKRLRAATSRYSFVAKPPREAIIRRIKYSIFHEQEFLLAPREYGRARARAHEAVTTRPRCSRAPRQITGRALKSPSRSRGGTSREFAAERSNIIQKRRKLFLDAKVSPFYIGRNSFGRKGRKKDGGGGGGGGCSDGGRESWKQAWAMERGKGGEGGKR